MPGQKRGRIEQERKEMERRGKKKKEGRKQEEERNIIIYCLAFNRKKMFVKISLQIVQQCPGHSNVVSFRNMVLCRERDLNIENPGDSLNSGD